MTGSLEDTIATALKHAPEQGEWEWEEHCEGVAMGVAHAVREWLRAAGVVPAEPATHDTPTVEPAQAAEAFRNMFERPATARDGLDAAADFLDGLIAHANFHGYMDPDAGEVSTYLVLLMVRAAQHEAAVAAVDGEAPAT